MKFPLYIQMDKETDRQTQMETLPPSFYLCGGNDNNDQEDATNFPNRDENTKIKKVLRRRNERNRIRIVTWPPTGTVNRKISADEGVFMK